MKLCFMYRHYPFDRFYFQNDFILNKKIKAKPSGYCQLIDADRQLFLFFNIQAFLF